MAETRKLAAILAADVAGYSKLAAADEERTLARLRTLWSDLIAPTVSVHNGRVVKRTGDGSIIEFRSVVDAVRCAIEVQNGMSERNAGLPPELRIEFRVGVHLGDVVEESDGDLMGDGVNIASRLEGIAKPGAICLSEDAYRQVKSRLDLAVRDLGATQLKNIAEPVRVYSVEVGKPAHAKPTKTITRKQRSLLTLLGAGIGAVIVVAAGAWYFFGQTRPATFSNKPAHLSIVVLPFANLSGDPDQDYFADGITENLTTELSRIRDSFVIARNTAFTFKNKSIDTKEISKQLGMVREGVDGIIVTEQNENWTYGRTIIALAKEFRLPAIYPALIFVEGGGLMSFGTVGVDLFRDCARIVSEIFNGANPANIPISQPTKYELGLNLKTAKELGIEIPPSLLVQADRVIE